MKHFIQGILAVIIISLITSSANAQNVQIGYPLHQEFVSGQLAVYVQDGVTSDFAKNQFSDRGISIVKNDIIPVSVTLHNPKEVVVKQVKNHSAIKRYEMTAFIHDSTTVKDLKFADNMTEEEKEEAREKFLNQRDRTILFLTFKEEFTYDDVEAILSEIQEIGHFNLMASQRIIYVEVEERSESDQMEKIRALPFVVDVTRVAKAVTLR